MVLLMNKNMEIIGGKKIPFDIPLAPMDKVFFHYEESVLKWKYVYHRKIAIEKELSEEAMKCEEIIKLLQDAQVMEIVTGLSSFYPQLVKEFIVNISKDFKKVDSNYYRKVHVCGCCIGFSLAVINDYLGRGKLIIIDKVPNMKTIAQEITKGTYEDWHHRGLLPITNLSVKYAILNKFRFSN